MWPNPQEIADFVTLTEEVLNGKTSSFVQWQSEINKRAYGRVKLYLLLSEKPDWFQTGSWWQYNAIF